MPQISDSPSHLDDHLCCEPIEIWDQHIAAAQKPDVTSQADAQGEDFVPQLLDDACPGEVVCC